MTGSEQPYLTAKELAALGRAAQKAVERMSEHLSQLGINVHMATANWRKVIDAGNDSEQRYWRITPCDGDEWWTDDAWLVEDLRRNVNCEVDGPYVREAELSARSAVPTVPDPGHPSVGHPGPPALRP